MSLLVNVRRAVLVGSLGAWFLATTVKQEPTRKFTKLEKLEATGFFLPEWRFFAPNPGVHDNHLLYRDTLANGEVTPWQEVCVAQDKRKLLHVLWYPDRRMEKVIFDAMGELQTIVGKGRLECKEDLQVTVPYITLLNYVSYSLEHAPDAVGTQFLMARSKGYDETSDPVMVLLSNVHPLG
ncbi:hypothetical protein MHW47_29335 [Streptomyces sp. OfavH-34-F]|uniref:hypothetical protein n=1 Tax=unclassified Streptomyces TaxID=2593676 RepID=UPI001EF1FA71|nr:hypothetical protein [Streptomyces sp. OfavH-34-F]MCG7528532.1 hypothetical protein [Streptomyces sp. OfavH-34-F]